MKYFVKLLIGLLLPLSVFAQEGNSTKDTPDPSKLEFEVSAKLGYRGDPDFEIKTKAAMGVPFMAVAANKDGGVKLLSGVLRPESKGEYPIVLTVFYGTAQSNNMGWTADTKMKLDEPLSLGGVEAGGWSFTVKLSRIKAN